MDYDYGVNLYEDNLNVWPFVLQVARPVRLCCSRHTVGYAAVLTCFFGLFGVLNFVFVLFVCTVLLGSWLCALLAVGALELWGNRWHG